MFAPACVSEPSSMITDELFLNLVYCMQLRYETLFALDQGSQVTG